MPVFKLLYSFCGRIRFAKGRSATPDAEAPQKNGHESALRSVLPKLPGAPARATFGKLKPRTFGRAPVRRR